jgi:hypothetical protein
MSYYFLEPGTCTDSPPDNAQSYWGNQENKHIERGIKIRMETFPFAGFDCHNRPNKQGVIDTTICNGIDDLFGRILLNARKQQLIGFYTYKSWYHERNKY